MTIHRQGRAGEVGIQLAGIPAIGGDAGSGMGRRGGSIASGCGAAACGTITGPEKLGAGSGWPVTELVLWQPATSANAASEKIVRESMKRVAIRGLCRRSE